MVLIHDNDLARIQGDLQPDALTDYLQKSRPDIKHVLYGQYPATTFEFCRRAISLIDYPSASKSSTSSSGRVTITVAMLSDEFQPQGLPSRGASCMRKIKVYSNYIQVEIDPGTVLHHYDGTYSLSSSTAHDLPTLVP
jgi:hypothetical protein